MTPRHVVLLSLLLWPNPPADAQPPTGQARYFDGLRQRGLYGLAESVCLGGLKREDLSSDERLGLTLEFSRTLAEHAQVTHGSEQQELWRQAGVVLVDFLKSDPDHPEVTRVAVQSALIPLAQGSYLARLVDLTPHDRRLRDRALTALQKGLDRLGPLQQQLSADRTLASGVRAVLLATVRWRRAGAHVDRARLMDPATPDRASDLLAADTVLRQMSSKDLLPALARARRRLQAAVARRQGDYDKARRAISQAGGVDDDALLAERVWVERSSGHPAEAHRLLAERFQAPRPPSAELHYLRLACFDDLWQQALRERRTADAETAWEGFERQAARAEAVPDAYWAARSRQLAGLTRAIFELGPELALARDRAIGLYRAGRIDPALAAFDRAIVAAGKAGKASLAFELAFTRGSVLVQARRYSEAAGAFDALARHRPPQPRSAAAHLLWAWCLGRQLEGDPDRRAGRLADYRRALSDHRKTYPRDPTTPEATWLLALLADGENRPTRARVLWSEIPAGHARAAAAAAAIAASWEGEIDGLDPQDPRRADRLALAIVQIDRLIPALPMGETRWSVVEADLAVRLARLRLKVRSPDFARADALLQVVLARGPDPDSRPPDPRAAAVRATANQLRVLSLAGQQRIDDARRLIEGLASRPAVLLDLLDGLDRIAVGTAASTSQGQRRALGQLQLAAASRLQQQRSQLDQDSQLRLDRCLAQAYVATGDAFRAVEMYQRLIEADKKRPQLREQLAAIRVSIGNAQQLKEALADWRRAERLYKAGSNDWMRIRLETARTLDKAGQQAACLKLLIVTNLLYPDAGTPATRAGVDRLKKRLKSKSP